MAMFQGKRLGLYATKVDAAVAYACAVKDQELTAEEGTHSGRTRARGNASKEAVAGSAQEQEEAEEEEELVASSPGIRASVPGPSGEARALARLDLYRPQELRSPPLPRVPYLDVALGRARRSGEGAAAVGEGDAAEWV